MRISDWSSDVCSSDLLGQLALAYGGGHIDIIFLLGAGESAPPAIGGRIRQSLSDFLPTLRRAAMLRGTGGFRTLAIDMRQGGIDRLPQQMLEGHREIERQEERREAKEGAIRSRYLGSQSH